VGGVFFREGPPMMKHCPECGVDYPEGLLSALVTSGGTTAWVCGICALEISNRLFGVRRQKFQGEVAEDLRQAAIRWRRKIGVQP